MSVVTVEDMAELADMGMFVLVVPAWEGVVVWGAFPGPWRAGGAALSSDGRLRAAFACGACREFRGVLNLPL